MPKLGKGEDAVGPETAKLILRLIEDEPGVSTEKIVRLLSRMEPEDRVREALALLEDWNLIVCELGSCYPS
jgi:hypothetical protein